MSLGATQHSPDTRRFQFAFPSLDTLVQLENSSEGITIRATRNTFSERRKLSFMRELAAEGFIDEAYQSWSRYEAPRSRNGPLSPVCWLIDSSWVMPDKAARARTNSFMVRLIVGATVLWLAAMAALFLFSR